MMKRYPNNPILSRQDIPNLGRHLCDVSSVFNPGAVSLNGETILLLRVQNRGRETFLMVARSRNGVRFDISREVVSFQGLEELKQKVYHLYDPRITALDGTFYIMLAMDVDGGCRLGLAQTDDFCTFSFLGVVSDDDNRNGVLFPEKVGGRYLRLDRPNMQTMQSGVATGSSICLSTSDNLLDWQQQGEVFAGRWHYWDELIGAGPPPIKTQEGWLLLYHGVATHLNAHLYQMGVALLDLENPLKVIARGRYNILEPREPYELMGQVPGVVFPSGATVSDVDMEGCALPHAMVHIYYGAADTCVALAMTTVADLLNACIEDAL